VGCTGTTGWPAASSQSTTSPADRSMITGRWAGWPWRASRANVSASACSVCRNAQRSTTLPWSSRTVTSWLVLAQSHPTNFTLASSEEPIVDSTVSRPAAGVSLFGPRSGISLTPVTGPRRASGAAELKLAVTRRGNEAVP
jgi:hypothetical protein